MRGTARGRQEGLTLVELLVVMAVIALLAITVIAALQPMEQLRKARDKRRVGDARELIMSYERYLTSYQWYPWEDASVTGVKPGIGSPVLPNFSSGENSYLVIENGELKTSFVNRKSITENELWVSLTPEGWASVCFEPESQSMRSGESGLIKTKFNTTPVPDNDCDLPYTSSMQCFMCYPPS